ncbi:aminotransferase class I/II-fold pyridoxal phosphate-dependent enzyme [uncultured Agrococcus sp.]|uniref:aminotransferase class I/II-fold pyridoxal phosphate-dependent enzyme n=1 Tax=uncultured Agrococcus sp. TaxID=382258 RepID=UPI0025CC752E|nr:PLP-dependent aminotransferase family protein [uncultured Agrococcus sp.]
MTQLTSDALVDAVLLGTRSGVLNSGDRLPTIQSLSDRLQLSTSTISRAWSSLVQMGVVETKRRGGSRIVKPVQATSYRTRGIDRSKFKYNLAASYPDLSLQADLGAVLAKVGRRGTFNGYAGKDEVSPALQTELLTRLGYEPESLMLANDVIGALPRVLQAVAHRGSAVGVGDPEFPLYPIILKQAGMSTAPIPFGEHGYEIEALERALTSGVKALIVQTRVHNPTGRNVPGGNLREIAKLLREHDAVAIEIDHHGALVPKKRVRLASLAPERVILMTSFSKDIHADVRVASIAGPVSVMERVSVWRAGGDWVSGVNRMILEVCLTDPDVLAGIERARAEYDRRRDHFTAAFAEQGLQIRSNAGLSLWVPVLSEQSAMVSLAAKGISVAGGSAFTSRRSNQDHVHLSLGSLGEDTEYLCGEVLSAALIEAVRSPF